MCAFFGSWIRRTSVIASISILERSGPWGFGCASNKPGTNHMAAEHFVSVCVVTGCILRILCVYHLKNRLK